MFSIITKILSLSGWLRPMALASGLTAMVCSPAIQASIPLSKPSEMSVLAQHNLLLDVTTAGSRLIAVGEYGHILYSDDEGQHWTQVQTPISSTLNAVFFVDAKNGWAVGHEGVILATTDAGQSWTQQINGLVINQRGLEHARQLQAYAADNNEKLPSGSHPDMIADDIETLLYDAESFTNEGASRPLMDVWFKNENEGLVVGAYGLILRTTDGGSSWTPAFDSIYNIDSFHYYSLIDASSPEHSQALLISGEAGTLYRSLDAGHSWETLESPYEGTLFSGLYNRLSGDLLVFGLRGNLFKSTDLGSSWKPLESQTPATLASGVVLADGSYLLVGSAGVQVSIDQKAQHTKVKYSAKRAPYSATTITASGKPIFAGVRGIELTKTTMSTQGSH